MEKSLITDKVIILEPVRNLISFHKFDDIDYQIINYRLTSLIFILKIIIPTKLIEDGQTKFEIRGNHYNYSIRMNTNKDFLIQKLLHSFIENNDCCYLEINNFIHRNYLYKDIFSLEYNPLSFRQPDDSIREYIIQWFQQNIPKVWDIIMFFGGECTMLGKLLSSHSKQQYFYTDFNSIYNDIKHNYKNPLVNIINYKNWKAQPLHQYLHDILKCCIINTGYQGIKENLAREICNINPTEIYVISCNQNSWICDYVFLKEYYNLLEQIEIRTNYSIWIYKLTKKTYL